MIWFDLVGFYGISTIVGYLMPNPLYTKISIIWLGLVWFYGISTIVGYLMPNLIINKRQASVGHVVTELKYLITW